MKPGLSRLSTLLDSQPYMLSTLISASFYSKTMGLPMLKLDIWAVFLTWSLLWLCHSLD